MTSISSPCEFLSLATVALLSGRSVRTWQRRIEDGLAERSSDDSGRALVALRSVYDSLPGDWSAADCQALLRADQGDRQAQADVGAKLALQAMQARQPEGKKSAELAAMAQYFLLKAADQGEADAMYWLAQLNLVSLGEGATQGLEQALMWLAKSAAHGHPIAKPQVATLLAQGCH